MILKIKRKHFLGGLLILISLTNCKTNIDNKIESNLLNTDLMNNEILNNIASKRIFFGHQSVGFDIIDGINNIIHDYPECNLNITESKTPSGTGFFHSRIGENRNPFLKINDFSDLMKNSIADSTDIAFFKLCYIDINSKTDIEKLFESYKSNMDSLTSMYPNVKIIHFTSPLRTLDSGIKGLIKRILGKNSNILDNIARNKYNELIRKEYSSSHLFDIALWESTTPSGTRNYLKYKGGKVYSLANEYSNDGGHLNVNGKKILAKKLIELLANI